MQKLIINVETGEETYEDFTPEELATFEENRIKAEKLLQEEEEKSAIKTTAETKLQALGLSADEVKILFGLQIKLYSN